MEKHCNFTNEELKVLAKEIVELFTEVLKMDNELECLEVSDVAKELKHSVSEVRKLIKERKYCMKELKYILLLYVSNHQTDFLAYKTISISFTAKNSLLHFVNQGRC